MTSASSPLLPLTAEGKMQGPVSLMDAAKSSSAKKRKMSGSNIPTVEKKAQKEETVVVDSATVETCMERKEESSTPKAQVMEQPGEDSPAQKCTEDKPEIYSTEKNIDAEVKGQKQEEISKPDDEEPQQKPGKRRRFFGIFGGGKQKEKKPENETSSDVKDAVMSDVASTEQPEPMEGVENTDSTNENTATAANVTNSAETTEAAPVTPLKTEIAEKPYVVESRGLLRNPIGNIFTSVRIPPMRVHAVTPLAPSKASSDSPESTTVVSKVETDDGETPAFVNRELKISSWSWPNVPSFSLSAKAAPKNTSETTNTNDTEVTAPTTEFSPEGTKSSDDTAHDQAEKVKLDVATAIKEEQQNDDSGADCPTLHRRSRFLHSKTAAAIALCMLVFMVFMGDISGAFVGMSEKATAFFDPTPKPTPVLSDVTLRDFLTHPDGFHLAMAPSFFGFYAYFGTLMVFDEDLGVLGQTNKRNETLIRSVAGSSAGAMAAIMLSLGVKPKAAAKYACSQDLASYADFPGVFGALKGDKWEDIMRKFLEGNGTVPRLEHAGLPVAVTAFDVVTLREKILTEGCMAKAARASASFPGLFQPVLWKEDVNGTASTSVLIDGGLTDKAGLNGLAALDSFDKTGKQGKRVVNLAVNGWTAPLGPSKMPKGLLASEVASINIVGTPRPGPLSMSNGPLAVEAARVAIRAVLDRPMVKGEEEGHYILDVDASLFAKP